MTSRTFLLWCFLLLCCVQGKHKNLRDKTYLPYCKFDQDVIRDDVALNTTIQISDYVFTGKVSSDVTIEDNSTISFYVYTKRFFKNTGDLSARKEVKVTKNLREGEGTKCRQVVRFRYSAIFIGRKPQRDKTEVQLTISPVPVTLNNLDRVNAATKGENFQYIPRKVCLCKNLTSVLYCNISCWG